VAVVLGLLGARPGTEGTGRVARYVPCFEKMGCLWAAQNRWKMDEKLMEQVMKENKNKHENWLK
jgi:hypothetical protein